MWRRALVFVSALPTKTPAGAGVVLARLATSDQIDAIVIQSSPMMPRIWSRLMKMLKMAR